MYQCVLRTHHVANAHRRRRAKAARAAADTGKFVAVVTATTRKGIFLLDDKGNENIVDMVTLAFSASEQPTDFSMAMKDSEFVLLACDESSATCDFSKSAVKPAFNKLA